MKKLALLSLALLGLSACGVRGDLERPGPLWGPDNRTEAERAYEHKGEAREERAQEDAQGQ
ncbi:LPS translocon maturation chaperone LptM [Woodsholea maritima]|uniref:LPS translocon maturation chaperone LptM n=1 Tax=Woodsholea maritima TaxID=240237 RepID=UPI0003655E17|nr:lipoprotein [Woodsholea maritima]